MVLPFATAQIGLDEGALASIKFYDHDHMCPARGCELQMSYPDSEVNPMTIRFTEPAINYYVEDVEIAVRFYTENFGFTETFRTPTQGKPIHVEVTLGPLILGLASKEAAQTMHGLPLGTGGYPCAELVVWAENVDEAYAMLIAKGVPSVSAPHDFLSSLRAAWVMDPDGNPVEIVSRRSAHHASQVAA
jgi:catechol 2,3-dioxygenase-like lactoylglutathione lyase family enzyme